MGQIEVVYEPKSDWQKPDCHFCSNPATSEAVVSNGIATSRIRCCDNAYCRETAAKFAKIPFETS